ncbi:MAG: DNA/RNA nuclease SfsA [Bullifex sp.]
MRYRGKIIEGQFKRRVNRFTAICDVCGSDTLCHLRNTGRLQELLKEGNRVFLLEAENRERKTPCDIMAVISNGKIFNIDSSAPNEVAEEYVKSLFPSDHKVKREVTAGDSRFDLSVTSPEGKITYIEVKGCTKETDGVCSFPDAPSLRALKHVNELASLSEEGYGAVIIFVVQMEGMKYFTPDDEIMPVFRDALIKASDSGVKILALETTVTPDSVEADHLIPVCLNREI